MSILKRLFGSKNKPEKKVSNNPKESIAAKSVSVAVCPYCSEQLEKKPARKKKCPHCGNYILVRKGKLITENQKKVYLFTADFESMGVTVQSFNKHKKALSQEWGNTPKVNDVFWRILNDLISKQKDLSKLVIIYEKMGHIAKEEGKNPSTYYEQAKKLQVRIHRSTLQGHKDLGFMIVGVQVAGMNDSHQCSYCRSIDRKVYSIDQALSEMPLPGKCSAESRCRCMYIAVFDDD